MENNVNIEANDYAKSQVLYLSDEIEKIEFLSDKLTKQKEDLSELIPDIEIKFEQALDSLKNIKNYLEDILQTVFEYEGEK